MEYKRASSIGEISRTISSRKGRNVDPFSLEELLSTRPSFAKDTRKRAYFIEERTDSAFFGIDGSSRTLKIPQGIYDALGSPGPEQDIPLPYIFRAAGYQ